MQLLFAIAYLDDYEDNDDDDGDDDDVFLHHLVLIRHQHGTVTTIILN